ncbi:MAG TPA: hypothetical protein VEK75_08945 [Xanthobacteraceae bacterium]|nr:hypothetical protein [Xanthobacteraceae bacterium]
MAGKAKSPWIAAAALVGVLSAAAPALAVECDPYGCRGDFVVRPEPYVYERHQYLTHGPDHDYTPMYFYDGHGGYAVGQWYWGGLTWRYLPPHDEGPRRPGGW